MIGEKMNSIIHGIIKIKFFRRKEREGKTEGFDSMLEKLMIRTKIPYISNTVKTDTSF